MGPFTRSNEEKFKARRHELYNGHDWPALAQLCQTHLDAHPNDPKALHDLCIARYCLGQKGEAYDLSCRLLTAAFGPGALHQLRSTVEALVLQMRNGEASVRYHRHIYVLGVLYAEEGKWDKALEVLEPLVALGRHFSGKFDQLVALYAQHGFFDRMLGLLTRCEVSLSDRPDLMDKVKSLVAPYAMKHLELARYFLKDDPTELISEEQIQDLKDPQILFKQGVLALTRNQTGLSRMIFARMLMLAPENHEAAKGLMAAAMAAGDVEAMESALPLLLREADQQEVLPSDVVALLEQAQQHLPEHRQLRALLVAHYLCAGFLDPALFYVNDLEEDDPLRVQIWAFSYERMIQEYEYLLGEDQPPETFTVSAQGKTVSVHPSQGFLAQWEKRASLDQESVLVEMAKICIKVRNHWPEAEKILNHLTHSPGPHQAHAFLLTADLYREMGKSTLAAKALSRMTGPVRDEQLTQYKELLWTIGRDLQELERSDEAHGLFATLFELDMNYKEVQRHVEETRPSGLPLQQDLDSKLDLTVPAAPPVGEPKDMPPKDTVAKTTVSVSPSDPPPGPEGFPQAALKRYARPSKIGEGGMGLIFKARDKKLDREVAIKVIAKKFQNDEESLMRFVREAKMAASLLIHPGIIAVLDIETQGDPYIVMECVDGRNLREILKRKKTIPVAAAVPIIRQACEALHFAHEQGVIHRDIKPDNIMINNHNKVKITDFGLARLEDGSRLTRDGIVLGTPAYMAPEQIRGRKLDRRADVYALGVTLYQMITGTVPFPEGEASFRQVHEDPEAPSKRRKGLAKSLDAVVLKAIARDRDDRYKSMEAFKEALKRVS